jgi:NAD(P)-dependent dehydrogenase (short-subunit alcohol dehydrogenase family)
MDRDIQSGSAKRRRCSVAAESYKGKVALVTGAATKRGMGRAIALRLARAGADVSIIDKYASPSSNYPGDEGWRGLEEEIEEIKACGVNALSLTVDITKGNGCNEAVARVVEQLGKIDIFVHAAGIRGPVGVPVIDFTEEDWKEQIDVNLTGSFLISKPVARHMVGRGGPGKMILIGSVASKEGVAGGSGYAASKWGVLGLTKSLALEVARYKINVNAVCPGFINTNLRDTWIDEQAKAKGITAAEFREKWYAESAAAAVPLGYYGTAEEIADVVMFLVSKEADYMTGQAINVTGGACMV